MDGSSDQGHMIQEVCQHFSSTSLTVGMGLYPQPGWKINLRLQIDE